MKKILISLIIVVSSFLPLQAQGKFSSLKYLFRKPPTSVTWGALKGGRPMGIELRTVAKRRVFAEIEQSKKLTKSWEKALCSSFGARPSNSPVNNVFSGVVFQSEHTGKIYGAVSTHALATLPVDGPSALLNLRLLTRNFNLQAFDVKGNEIQVPAKVVQLGAFGTIDVSLVELDPSAWPLFTPARITKQPVFPGQKLVSQGFTKQYTVFVPNRQVLGTTSFSIRTTMPGPEHLRGGCCGGPVFNEEGELVAIHTGSKAGEQENGEDMGYATKAQFLESLVEAYESNTEVLLPFNLGDRHITDLKINEYISGYVLRNEQGKELYFGFATKFPFKHVQLLIDQLSPHYLDLTIGHLQWAKEDEQFMQFKDKVRAVRYDFKTGKTSPLDIENEFCW